MKSESMQSGGAGMSEAESGFKSMSANESESLFQSVKSEDMNITMQEANISTTGYVSDEIKEQQQFHHYNNTNFFVTFRAKYLKQTPIKELANNVIKPFLLASGNVTSVKVRKMYQSYVIFELGS